MKLVSTRMQILVLSTTLIENLLIWITTKWQYNFLLKLKYRTLSSCFSFSIINLFSVFASKACLVCRSKRNLDFEKFKNFFCLKVKWWEGFDICSTVRTEIKSSFTFIFWSKHYHRPMTLKNSECNHLCGRLFYFVQSLWNLLRNSNF